MPATMASTFDDLERLAEELLVDVRKLKALQDQPDMRNRSKIALPAKRISEALPGPYDVLRNDWLVVSEVPPRLWRLPESWRISDRAPSPDGRRCGVEHLP